MTALLYPPHDPLYNVSAWGQLYRTILTVERICGVFRPADATPVVVLRSPDGRQFPFLPAPDYYNPSRYCLMTPWDTHLSHNIMTKQAFGALYSEQVAEIPYLHRSDLFEYTSNARTQDEHWRAYLKEQVKNNYISHFFGEKSKRIRWQVTPYNHDINDGVLIQEHIDHSLLVAEKSDEKLHPYSIAALAITEGAFDLFELNLRAVHSVRAYDTVTQEVVCLMNVTREQEGLVCKRIAVSHDPQYKPYSLVAMANLWAIRHFLYNSDANYLDLGTNFNTSGKYKDGFVHRVEPLYNFPAQDSLYALGQWLNEHSSRPYASTTSVAVSTIIYES